ncbi:hypothetical protein [Microbacterium sp. W4I20]|uniref:hypothetical protein n=1 Tax=Microbacterium sp. W4I20 TaxID=3042262 RepID=UPI0027D9082B|nr:hypothetical protein [Microbacterium sp. W4I20]
MSDDAADLLVEYAALLGQERSADAVRLRAIGQDGNEVEVDFVLNPATNLASESTNSSVQPPSNKEAIAYLRAKIDAIRNPPEMESEDAPSHSDEDSL